MKTIKISGSGPLIPMIMAGMMIVGLASRQSLGQNFQSFGEFREALGNITGISDSTERIRQENDFWSRLKADHQIPFKLGDSVAFLYRAKAGTVSWAGDFNGWKPAQPGYIGVRQGNSDIWLAVQKFPPDARLDYKIITDGNWILDPDNPYTQMGGMGLNSELHMPDWRFPDDTEPVADMIRGKLSDSNLIMSKNLGYEVSYRVYTPYNYTTSEGLPVIYVTDGQDYTDDEKGAMLIVLDNLIFREEIRPLIAVFLDPREPGNPSNNRRLEEYNCSQKFADFLGDELVPLIDKTYKTHVCPDDRAILGTSVGGINSAWIGAVRVNDFHLLGINSPAFTKVVLDRFSKLDWYPFRVFMTTGVYFDTQKQALDMKAILEKNKVDFQYREVNEGHSWGNWRALMGDMLRYFFHL